MEEIDDWDTGKKSVVGEAIDKAKDLWNRAQGKYPANIYDQYAFTCHASIGIWCNIGFLLFQVVFCFVAC